MAAPRGTPHHPTLALPDGNADGPVSLGGLGSAPFTLSAKVNCDGALGTVLGDIAAQFDAESRSGFSVGVNTQAVVTAQANHKHLHFSMDGGSAGEWSDCGRPGSAIQVVALATFEGALFAGTYEDPGSGKVYRYSGEGEGWDDLGSPDPCNAVQSIASLDGQLYVGTGTYRASGSALELSDNMLPGGTVYRWLGGTSWQSTGTLPPLRDKSADNPHAGIQDYGSPGSTLEQWSEDRIDTVGAMCTFNGKLWATPLYHRGVFSYDGGSDGWQYEGDPGVRLFALAAFEGRLYGAGNQGCARKIPFSTFQRAEATCCTQTPRRTSRGAPSARSSTASRAGARAMSATSS
eukprot:COSAG04_NODE_694_length_11068_cov_5.641718_4_plen_348_part_00